METAPALVEIPTRYRAAEKRNARLGLPLKLVTRLRTVDEDQMERLARGFMEVDDLGGDLARAMRLPKGDPNRVSMDDFRRALDGGVESIPDAPPALRKFFETVEAVPDWVDWEQLERGAEVGRWLGQNAADVLLDLSLIGGYRYGGPTDLLVATGGLVGGATMRRLGETQKWTVAVSRPGAMRRDGEGFKLTLHVRLMHALVNDRFASKWDVDRWGMPVSQSDQAGTLSLFSGVLLLASRGLGVPISREDSNAVMHLWRYIGWLMGVDDRWLMETEREQHVMNYHILLAQDDISEAGPKLAQAIVDAQSELHFDRFATIRRWYARERMLSMLTALLGPRSMRDLGLPLRPPWAIAYVIVFNQFRYRLFGRTPAGRRALIAWGDRVQARELRKHFGPDHPEVGTLPV
jgi:hypothetical protein